MSIEVGVSILAVLLALLSAVYARRAASEAKNANRISSHHHKLAILEAARDFKHIFTTQGEAIDASLIYALHSAADKASLYFTAPVASHLSEYAKSAYDVLIVRDSARGFESAGLDARPKWAQAFELVDHCREIEGDLLTSLESQTKLV